MTSRIEIVGLLGSGKTTLLNKIELQNNNYLNCVYEDLSPLSDVWQYVKETNNSYYLLQSSYYLESYYKIQKAITKNIIITDFSLRVHHFVYSLHRLKQKNINPIEWEILNRMYNLFSSTLPSVAGYIIIEATPQELLQNLQQRKRELDYNTPIEYLMELVECYNAIKPDILFQLPAITFNIAELKEFNDSSKQKLIDFISEKTAKQMTK